MPQVKEQRNPWTNKQEVAAFTRRYSLNLPNDYQKFLITYNGGRPVPPYFPIEGSANNPFDGVRVFFGLNATNPTEELYAEMEMLQDLIPAGILPVAFTDGNDYVCFDLRGEKERVVFWNRKPFWRENIWNEKDLYFVAPDFTAFFEGLRKHPEIDT